MILKKSITYFIVLSILFHCNFIMKESSEDTFPKTASFFVASDTVADGVSDVDRVEGGGGGDPSPIDPPTQPPGTPIIPRDKTYLRVKVQQDQPAVTTQSEGILHFILDYADMDRFIYSPTGVKEEGKTLDNFILTLKEVEIKPVGKPKMNLPPTWSKVKLSEMNQRYASIFNNLKVPAGEYEYIKVYLYQSTETDPKSIHTISVNEVVSNLNIRNETILEYKSSFSVKKGKLTTLFSKPSSSKITNVQGQYELDLDTTSINSSIHNPIDTMVVNVKSISITNESGTEIVLNDTPNRFDLLSLHGTSVILMANQLIPAGRYMYMTLKLGDVNPIEIENEGIPLRIVNNYEKVLYIKGPFDLDEERVTEVIVDLDPNQFIFQSLENGYFINPTANSGSVVNFGGVQDIRVMTALEGYSNVLLREAELIFEGIAESITYEVSNNIHGKPMIYSNVKIKLTDKIRGEALEDMEYFDLKVIGGVYQGVRLEVPSMPKFEKNEKVILFLKKYGERYSVMGGKLGKISL